MKRSGSISRFVWRFALVFTAFVMGWAVVGSSYAGAFCGAANLVYRSIGPHGRTRFMLIDDLEGKSKGAHDIEIVLRDRRVNAEERFVGSTRLQGYRPTTFLAALILATPMPWRRRWRAMLWGLVLIHAYVALRVLTFLLWAFGEDSAIQLFTLGAATQGLLNFAHWFFVVSFGGWLVVPIPIWFLLSFNADDLRGWVSRTTRV